MVIHITRAILQGLPFFAETISGFSEKMPYLGNTSEYFLKFLNAQDQLSQIIRDN